jgi:hypothetical protein
MYKDSSSPDIVFLDTTTTAGVTYIGKTSPSQLTSDPVWLIIKFDESGSPSTLKYANGTPSYTQIWDARASLSYS